jgi:formiminotetrahydrofolate cyclodeaminase
MEKACEGIELAKEFADKGSKLALSDAGVSAIMLKSALQGASLNVFINTSAMKDREEAEADEKKANAMLDKYTAMAEDIFNSVRERL